MGRLSEEAVAKVREFLEKMGLEFKYVEEDKVFVVPFVSEDGRRFNVVVAVRGDWVTTAAIAAKRDELPRDVDERKLYELLLRLSFEMNEVTFGLTDKGDVVVHAESHVKALSLENFRIEFASVVFGVEYFARKVAPDYPRLEAPKDLSRLLYVV
ncbi:MAG TPA: hypothetical protein ENF34_00695 [Candidatus Bathyarchaeota archaeon]|nr:hypothetical protein [Candidatus Bathyarchaeota archaeon]